jgi:hypothetical protein
MVGLDLQRELIVDFVDPVEEHRAHLRCHVVLIVEEVLSDGELPFDFEEVAVDVLNVFCEELGIVDVLLVDVFDLVLQL